MTEPLGVLALARTDDVLRRLLAATLLDSLGRGATLTLVTLYLVRIVGVAPVTAGAVLTAAGAAGIGAALVAGHLADRWSGVRMLVVLHLVQGVAVAAWATIGSGGQALATASAAVVACLAAVGQQGNSTVRSVAVGRAFPGRGRVAIRAAVRTATNVGIGLGTAAAALPLALGTASAYRVALVGAGVLLIASAPLLGGIDRSRADAVRASGAGDPSPTDTPASPPTGVASPVIRSPFRDARFLGIATLNGVFAVQFGVFEVAVPLWVVERTSAPAWTVSLLVILNAATVVALQSRLSRSVDGPAAAGRAMVRAGAAMVVACGLWASAAAPGILLAVTVLVVAALVHSIAEIVSSAAGWTLAFELAPSERLGAYQGVFGTGSALGQTVAPVLVTATTVGLGVAGWAVLAAIFAASALGVAALSAGAEASRRGRSAVP